MNHNKSLHKDTRFRMLLLITILVLTIGTIFYHLVEGWSILDSLYFVMVTLTTVGFGDFSPQTNLGKLFTIFYLFIGVGVILTFVNILAKRDIDTLLKHKLNHDHNKLQKIEEELKETVKNESKVKKSLTNLTELLRGKK